MEQQLLSQVASAAVVVYGLEALKKWEGVAFVSQETKRLNRVIGAAGAALAAIGIHVAFDATAAATGTYVITVTGLTGANMLHAVWDWVSQWALQQLAYDSAVSSNRSKGAGQ